MIYIYLQKYRSDFLKWATENLFKFEEIHDLDLLFLSNDMLVTDDDKLVGKCSAKIVLLDLNHEYSNKSMENCVIIQNISELAVSVPVYCKLPAYREVNTDKCWAFLDNAWGIFAQQRYQKILPTEDLITTNDSKCETESEPTRYSTATTPHLHANIKPNPIQQDIDIDTVEDLAPVEESTTRFSQPEDEPRLYQQPEVCFQQQTDLQTDVSFQQQAYQQKIYSSHAEPTKGYVQQVQTPLAPAITKPFSLESIKTTSATVRRGSRKNVSYSRRSSRINTDTNIILFFGITPKTGVSCLCYLFASYVAGIMQDKQCLLVDMDVNQPDLTKLITTGNQINPNSDTNLINLVQVPLDQLGGALPALISEMQVDSHQAYYSQLSSILNTNVSFVDKRNLSAWNFNQHLQTLSNYYDYIFVDCGRLQSTTNYQLHLLSSNFQKVFVASGLTHSSISEFVQTLSPLMLDYRVVLNRTNKNLTGAQITRTLGKDILATFPNILTIESLISQGRNVFDLNDEYFIRNLEQLREGLGV